MTTRSEAYHDHRSPAYDAKYDEPPLFKYLRWVTILAFPLHAFTIPKPTGPFAANGLRVARPLAKPLFFQRLQAGVREKPLVDDGLARRMAELDSHHAEDPGWAGPAGTSR
jgi:hypothetical protein